MDDDVTVERKAATLTCDDGTKLHISWNEIRTPMGYGVVSIRQTAPRFEIVPSALREGQEGKVPESDPVPAPAPAPTGETPR